MLGVGGGAQIIYSAAVGRQSGPSPSTGPARCPSSRPVSLAESVYASCWTANPEPS